MLLRPSSVAARDKENTPPRPPSSALAAAKSPIGCRRRLPLRKHVPSNALPEPGRPRSTPEKTPDKAPAALPSTSPDMLLRRKVVGQEVGSGCCFGIGPTVQGSVKDRRKSKPRALLTVEPLPNAATLVWDEAEEVMAECPLPVPGRASLEWISEPESDFGTTSESTTTESMDESLDHFGRDANLTDLMSRVKLGTTTSFFGNRVIPPPEQFIRKATTTVISHPSPRPGLRRCTGRVLPRSRATTTTTTITPTMTTTTRSLAADGVVPGKHRCSPLETQGRQKRQCKASDKQIGAGPRAPRQAEKINLSQFLKASRDLSQQQPKYHIPSLLGVSANLSTRKNGNL